MSYITIEYNKKSIFNTVEDSDESDLETKTIKGSTSFIQGFLLLANQILEYGGTNANVIDTNVDLELSYIIHDLEESNLPNTEAYNVIFHTIYPVDSNNYDQYFKQLCNEIKINITKKYVIVLSDTYFHVMIQFDSLEFISGFHTYSLWMGMGSLTIHSIFEDTKSIQYQIECQLPSSVIQIEIESILNDLFLPEIAHIIWEYQSKECGSKCYDGRCVTKFDERNGSIGCPVCNPDGTITKPFTCKITRD